MYCNKGIAHTQNLKSHLRKHASEKPYICFYQNCNKLFSTKDKQQLHHLKHIKNNDLLIQYRYNKSGKKPATSQGKKAKKKAKTHKKSKSKIESKKLKIKVYQFKLDPNNCNATFLKKQDLIKHKLTIHGDKLPFKCHICSKGLLNEISKKIHLREKHHIQQP